MSCLSLLPILGVICALLAFCTSYIVAVIRGDVYPWWPYISDTGTTVPESCVFGELLTMTAVITFCTMFTRYKLVEGFKRNEKKTCLLNVVALVSGAASCFGMTLVANFQETSVQAVHMPGAAVAFGAAVLYNFIHSFITKRMYPDHNGFYVYVVRITISICSLLAFLSLYVFGEISRHQGKAWYGNDTDKRLNWDPKDPGWPMHLVSTISEWILGVTCMMFFLTYVKEFKIIQLKVVPEFSRSHVDPEPVNSMPDESSRLLAHS